VDKPAGPTSHDVVDRVRRALGTPRVGHTGTLDPFATGVLAVCIGKATRLARFLAAGEKRYAATVGLGFATTTDDFTGQPLGEPCPVAIDRERVERACRRFVGTIEQTPPAFSAKRVAGRRLYERARAGEGVRPAAARVTVYALEVVRAERDQVEIAVRCSSGTYIRAIGRDLGEALGVGGHLTALRRTANGGFSLAEAVAWDDLDPSRRDELTRRLVPMGSLLGELPTAAVGPEGVDALRHGRDLGRNKVVAGFPEGKPPERLRIVDDQGRLLALAVPVGFGPGTPGLPLEPALHPDLVLLD
jgi:tRNA pseudouridine55 synthase